MTRERPVLFAFVVGAIPVLAAFILEVLDATGTATPDWLTATLAGLGPLLGTLTTLWAQSQVTPTADPKLDDGTPLVPDVTGRARPYGRG